MITTAPGSSPVSRPQVTGISAPTTAQIGATIPIRPTASTAVEESEADRVREARGAAVGEVAPIGDPENTSARTMAPAAALSCETSSTTGAGASLEARPPRKSPLPKKTADSSPTMTPIG